MDYPPSINPSGSDSSRRETPPIALRAQQTVAPSRPLRSSDPSAWIEILRQAVTTGIRSTDSILHAATDAARILTGAHGTALALRTNGVIVCRARSGDIAPEIGSPLDADSGISGASIRRASLLVCNDAANDTRVDATACLALGIRSIVVVPLQGPAGIVGILEAFSTRPHAFGAVHIKSLRELAAIAESAYERDGLTPSQRSSLTDPVSGPNSLFASPDAIERICSSQFSGASSARRRYWIPALVTLALLLVSLVVWMSWIDPSEIAASAPPPESIGAPALSDQPAPRVPPQTSPETVTSNRKSERSRHKNVMVNAAELEPTGGPHPSNSATALSAANPAAGNLTSPSASSSEATNPAHDPSPSTVVSPAPVIPDSLIDVTSTSATLPTSDAGVSSGVAEGTLIRRLDPTYPPNAKAKRLAGSVVLDVTIAEDGSVREAHVVAGPPQLAKAATDAVQQWRYNPLKLNGRPVAFHQQITIIFKLP
jgi:TonB family protein